jgi:hypothetical protein
MADRDWKSWGDEFHRRVLGVIEALTEHNPAPDSPEGRLLKNMRHAAATYERARDARCPECRGAAMHKMDCSRRNEPLPRVR